MQNPYSSGQRPEHSKPSPEQTSLFKHLNPRSSYQEEHSNYFEKLQQQLLEKSNRYTSLIGKKNFAKPCLRQAPLNKVSQTKPSTNSSKHQNRPTKNNSFSHLTSSRKDPDNSSLHKNPHFDEETKYLLTQNPSHLISSHSRTYLHSELQQLRPKNCISRQQTERNHEFKLQNAQQKSHQKPCINKISQKYFTENKVIQKQKIPQKYQKYCTAGYELTNKIDQIKKAIDNFNNAKKAKLQQKAKESPLEIQRKLVYNLTYEDSNPSSVEDLLQGPTAQSRMKQNNENHLNHNKFTKQFSKDNLSSTMSTKISINQNSNESSKISFFKKQNEFSQHEQFGREKQIEKETINLAQNKIIQPFNNMAKMIPQMSSKMSLKSSLRQSKPMSIKDFVIMGQIGEGKAGTVYMAKHLESNFVCALKVINRQILNEPVIVQLVRQIQIQFYLDHPNIVQLYAFFSDESHIYLMLELCFSGNLYTYLRREKILTESEIKPIIRQVCYALEFMHDNNIIHRDLKPQNILFHQNVVKICDLGWAVYSPLPRDTLCGTPIYASPELVEKKKYNSKIDVWNVGVMAYELLCGRVPFEIRSEEDLYKVVLEEIHFPKSIPISDFCKDFINNCLKKQPEKRKTITELLEHIFLNENIS